MSAQFRHSLENFRGLAIVFVMLSHLASLNAVGRGIEFAYYIVGSATAWFIFLSGYLFYYVERDKFVYSHYLAKKARFVVLPYLILSVIGIAAGLYLRRPELLDLGPLSYAAWSLVVGGAVVAPMWFIPMILIFFLFSPIFIQLAQTRMIYFLAALGIVFSIFSFRPINGTNPPLAFLHFSGFYLLGVAFAAGQSRLDALRYRVKSLLILSCSGLFAASFLLYEGRRGAPLGFFDGLGRFNSLQFGKLALLLAIFFSFERYLNIENRVLGYTAKISFGLFFVHGFYLLLFQKLRPVLLQGSDMLIFFEEFGIVIVASFATVALIKHFLGKASRYVIGC